MAGDPTGEMYSKITMAESAKQPEAPSVAKPEAVKPVDKLGQKNAIAALNKTTPGVPDRADLQNLAGVENANPWNQFMAQEDNTPLAGGELVTSTAIRVGETPQQAQERGWVSAITSAYGRELPQDQKQANIQEIVDAAKKAGVSSDVLRSHIQNLGLSAVTAEQQVAQVPVNASQNNESGKTPQQSTSTESTTQTDENKVDPISQGFVDRIRTIGTAALNDQQNVDLANQLKGVLAEAVNAGIPRNQIRTQLAEMGFNVAKNNEVQQSTEQPKPESMIPTLTEQFDDPNLSPQEKKNLDIKLAFEVSAGGIGKAVAERAIQDKILKALSINTSTPEEIQVKQAFLQEQVELAKQRGVPAEIIQSWFGNTGVHVTKKT